MVWIQIACSLLVLAVLAWGFVSLGNSARRRNLQSIISPVPNATVNLRQLMNQSPIAYFELNEAGRFTFRE